MRSSAGTHDPKRNRSQRLLLTRDARQLRFLRLFPIVVLRGFFRVAFFLVVAFFLAACFLRAAVFLFLAGRRPA